MLTDKQRIVLVNELRKPEYSGLSAAQAYSWLHDYRPQPDVVTTVPSPLSIEKMLGAMGKESRARLAEWVHADRLAEKIVAGDRPAILLWGKIMVDGGIISQVEYDQVAATVSATVDVSSKQEPLPPRTTERFNGAYLREVYGREFVSGSRRQILDKDRDVWIDEWTDEPLSMPSAIDRADFDSVFAAAQGG